MNSLKLYRNLWSFAINNGEVNNFLSKRILSNLQFRKQNGSNAEEGLEKKILARLEKTEYIR